MQRWIKGMRDVFFKSLFNIAKRDKNVILITADTGAICHDEFKRELSSQYINIGIAEQNMVGVAAGLIKSGKIVYIYGIIPFVIMRCYEQIRVDLCCMDLPVTIVGIGAGLDYSTLGPTHHGVEDIALMRSLPRTIIYNPSDSFVASMLAKVSYKEKDIKYIRLDRIGFPLLYKDEKGIDFSKGFSVLKRGKDLYIIATGRMVYSALKIAKKLSLYSINAGVIDLFKIKPLNKEALWGVIKKRGYIVTIEEHFVAGGIGSIIAEMLVTKRDAPAFKPIGIPNRFCDKYGNREYLQRLNKLDVNSVTETIEQWIKGQGHMPFSKTHVIFSGDQKLSLKTLKGLLFTMLKVRMVEEEIARLYPRQEMRCPTHLWTGQEAISAGVCASLKIDDIVFASHRAHGYYLALGGDLNALMAELYGKATGCAKGKGGSQHIVSPEIGLLGTSAIVAGTIPIAVGAALSSAMQRKGNVALVDFGDGAMDEGLTYESLNFAALKKLPVVFICENNFYATHAHQSVRQAKDNIFQKAEVFGVSSTRINGNDVVNVFSACKKAVESARSGKGPILIECRTYRWKEHVGPDYDYDLGYRTRRELNEWIKSCPIKMFKGLLFKEGLIEESEITQMLEKIRLQIKEAVAFAKKSPFPSHDELLKDVYSP